MAIGIGGFVEIVAVVVVGSGGEEALTAFVDFVGFLLTASYG